MKESFAIEVRSWFDSPIPRPIQSKNSSISKDLPDGRVPSMAFYQSFYEGSVDTRHSTLPE